jgi:hypothetical protein
MKMRKFLAMLLTLSLVLSLSAPMALAVEDGDGNAPAASEPAEKNETPEGDKAPETPEGNEDKDAGTDSGNPGGDEEKPPVTDPENPDGDGEKPPVTDPENPDGDGEKPPVTEPENPDGEKPPVTEPENPGETEEPPYFVDEEGNKVDKDGYLVDDEGNQLLDQDGNPVKAEDKDKIQGDLEDINKPPLTPEEQEALDELGGKADAITGETSREELESIKNSPLYDRLTEEQKKAVEDALAALALLEQPVIPPVGGTLYERLMAAQTIEEFDAILAEYTEEELAAEWALLTEEQIAALEAHRAALEGVELPHNEGYIPYVTPEDSVNVGPLVASKAKETNTLGPQKTQRRAMARQVDPDSDPVLPGDRVEGLHTKKTYDAKTGELTIEAYAEATVKPADIVLVLDQSEMMSYCSACGQMIPKEDHIGAGHLIYDGQKCGHSLKTDRLTNNHVTTVSGVDYYQFRNETEAMTAMNGLEAKDFKTLFGGGSCNETQEGHTFGRMWIAGVDKEGNITGDHIGRDGYVGVNKKCEFFGKGTYDTRETVMEAAVNEFLSTMAEKNGQISDNDYKHRVAVVGYNNDAETLLPLEVISENSAINYHVEEKTTNKPSTGLNAAKTILDAAKNTSSVERDQIVILFTSGRPGEQTTYRAALVSGGTAFDSAEAKSMQNAANKLGNATLYSIGVYSGASSNDEDQADNYQTVSKSDDNLVQNANGEWVPPTWDTEASKYANHLLTNISNGGFSSASNKETLQSVFEEIGNQIQAKVNLTNPVLKDVISQYFKIPEGDKVSAKAVEMNGASPVDVPVNVTGKTVKVVDFDFSAAENVVLKDKNGNMLRGRKLVVTIPIERENQFWGGNNVPTNVTSQSGIFDQGGTVCVQGLMNEEGEVKSPRTDVSLLNVQLIPQDVNIYYSNPAPDADALHQGDSIRVQYAGDNGYTDVDYGSLTWQTDYAKLSDTAVLAPENQTISSTEDGGYTVSREVVPTGNGTVKKGTATFAGNEKANVNVFTPTVSFGDMRTYLTVVAPVEEHMPESVVWKHGSTEANSDENSMMTGDAPELKYTILGRVNALYGEDTNNAVRDYYAFVTEIDFGNGTKITHRNNDGTFAEGHDEHIVTFEQAACVDIHTQGFDAKTGEFLVHVFKPEITFTDVTTYKGTAESDVYFMNTPVVRWVYPGTEVTLPNEKAPSIVYQYTPRESDLYEGAYYQKDTPVKVQVQINGREEYTPAGWSDPHNINECVTFKWDHSGCKLSNPNELENAEKVKDPHQLWVHVETCDLTVTKSVDRFYDGSGNDGFIFHIKGSGNPLAETVDMDIFMGQKDDFKGVTSASKVITGLPVGEYTVTEDSNWSWRYKLTSDNDVEKILDASSPEGTVSFMNSLNNEKWLSSEDVKVNTFNTRNPGATPQTLDDASLPEERETGHNDEIPDGPETTD